MNKTSETLQQALAAWQNSIGTKHVVTDKVGLEALESATFETHQKIFAIIYPGTTAEVQQCLEIANRYKVAVYPISSGKNWGYGSGVPVRDCVVMHLKRMNHILELNEELSYVVVEAGVTQKQLSDFLREKTKNKLWMDATAAAPLSSIIGNVMERGHGTTAYCDHIAKCTNFEVVLADGTCLHTGYGAFPEAKTANADKWGLGPSIDGLFTQSNLGVVTKMTIWLMPASEFVQAVFFGVDNDAQFAAVTDAIRALRLEGTIKCGPHFGNVYTNLLRLMSFPWELTQGKTPLPHATALELAKQYKIAAWNGVIALYGTKAEVTAARQQVEKKLHGLTTSISFFDPEMITEEMPEKRVQDMTRLFDALTGGVPGVALPRTYWRMKIKPPSDTSVIDLDKDKVGLIYTGAGVPFTGNDARTASQAIAEVFFKHGFEPVIGIYPVRDRILQYHIALSYDRSVDGEDAKALACQAELNAKLQSLGYYPHRLNLLNVDVMTKAEPAYTAFVAKLKATFDPNNIIAPGRYGF